MASVEMRAGGEPEKRFDRKLAWWAKWGGLGIAIVGAVTRADSLVVPGLLVAGAGWGYESLTDPNKKAKTESSGSVTVFQRAKEIYSLKAA